MALYKYVYDYDDDHCTQPADTTICFFGHFQNFLIAVAMSEQFFRSTVLFSEHTIEF